MTSWRQPGKRSREPVMGRLPNDSGEDVFEYISTHLPPMIDYIVQLSVYEQEAGSGREGVLWIDDLGIEAVLRYAELFNGQPNRIVEMNRGRR